MAKEKGYIYDATSGNVYGLRDKNNPILNKSKGGYLRLGVYHEKKIYTLKQHQFAWFCIHNEVVDCIDHINGNKTDNRIENLRSVSYQQNQFNKKVKGYSYNKKSNKWIAAIAIDRKDIYLGGFDTEEEAREAYLAAKKIYHII